MGHTTPPLHGVRIIESSMLGPGAITTHLADLGAEIIKVESPQGDYIREMTWPIVEGVSLMHLHISRGKRIDRARPAHAGGRRHLPRPRAGRRRGHRGDAPRRARASRPRLRPAARGQPSHRVLHDLRLRHDRPVQGHAEPRPRLRRVGRAREARDHRGRLQRHPRAPVDRASTPARCSARSACWPASSGPAATGEGCRLEIAQSDAAAAMDWLRSETWRAYERPESEVTGNKSDGYERRAPGHGRHARRRALPVLRDGRRPHPVPGVRAGVLGELLPAASTAPTCSRRIPARSTPTTRSATTELRRELQDIFLARTDRRVGRARRTRSTRRSSRSTRRRRSPTTRSSRTACRGSRRSASAPSSSPRRSSSSTSTCRCRPRRRPSASTPTRSCARSSATTTTGSRPCGRPAPSADRVCDPDELGDRRSCAIAADGLRIMAVRTFRFGVSIGVARVRPSGRTRHARPRRSASTSCWSPTTSSTRCPPLCRSCRAADATERLRVGTFVVNNDFRHPVAAGS